MKSLLITGLALSIISFGAYAAQPVYDAKNDSNFKRIQRTLDQNNRILEKQNVLLQKILDQQIIANKQRQQEQKEMQISEFSSNKDGNK